MRPCETFQGPGLPTPLLRKDLGKNTISEIQGPSHSTLTLTDMISWSTLAEINPVKGHRAKRVSGCSSQACHTVSGHTSLHNLPLPCGISFQRWETKVHGKCHAFYKVSGENELCLPLNLLSYFILLFILCWAFTNLSY